MATTAARRISTGIAWSAFAVLTWAALSVLLDVSASHAQDRDDGPAR
ncbi:hypothetical protein [Microbacterium sp.]|nr:hypothetical protein [Microbacterium sp.]